MKTAMLKVAVNGAIVTLLGASCAAFAQGGGNGQGGTGGGNAHSAATAGMTHLGDPVSGPNALNPRDMSGQMSKNELNQSSMQSANAQSAMKTGE